MREQAGNLNCDWATPNTQTDYAAITVTADANSGFDQNDREDFPSLGVGDASWVDCAPKGQACEASVVTGRYWFDIPIGQIMNGSQSPTDVTHAVATSVASRLAAAGAPLPVWQPPATSWSPVVSCDDLVAAVPMTDVMAPGPGSGGGWNGPGDENAINRWASRDAVFYNCAWDWKNAPVNQDMLIVQIVPGGEWVWPQLEASPGVTSTPLTVPGVTAGRVSVRRLPDVLG